MHRAEKNPTKPSVWLHHPSVVVVYGRRGSGKSTLIKTLCASWDAEGKVGLVDAISITGDVYADRLWREVPTLEELRGYSLLCVDDADLYLPQRQAARRSEVLTELLRRGRHYGLTLVLATQRPSALAYDAWSLADSAFIFSLTSEVDLRRAAELDTVIHNHKNEITRLQPGECYHWRAHESDRVKLTKISMIAK